jgi:hypothetical protein
MNVARALGMSSYVRLCAGAALLSASCVIEVNTEPRVAPLTEEEIREQQFNEFVDKFNAGLHKLDEGGVMGGGGSRFFWVSLDERLHSYDVLSTNQVDHEIPVSLEVDPAFHVATDAVVTVTYSTGTWQISAYAAGEPSSLIDTIAWPAAEGEPDVAPRAPIAIDGNSVYLLDLQNVLHRWLPGMGAPEPLFSLADRGIVLSTTPEFSVHGDDVLVLQEILETSPWDVQFALWHVELSGGEAQIVESSAFGVCFHEGGAVYKVDPEGALFGYSTSERRAEDLSALVRAAPVELEGLDFAIEDSYIFDYQCQPRGFTFNAGRGWFYFDMKTRGVQALHLQKSISFDSTPDFDNDDVVPFYVSSVILEHAAFLMISACTVSNDPMAGCAPLTIYRRDLSEP